jgi:hypothetical protein
MPVLVDLMDLLAQLTDKKKKNPVRVPTGGNYGMTGGDVEGTLQSPAKKVVKSTPKSKTPNTIIPPNPGIARPKNLYTPFQYPEGYHQFQLGYGNTIGAVAQSSGYPYIGTRRAVVKTGESGPGYTPLHGVVSPLGGTRPQELPPNTVWDSTGNVTLSDADKKRNRIAYSPIPGATAGGGTKNKTPKQRIPAPRLTSKFLE